MPNIDGWRGHMDGNPVLPGWDTFTLVVPVIGILVMAMFGLDEHLFTPRRSLGRRRFFCEVGANGGSFLSDPDGKPWRSGAVRPIEAELIRVDAYGHEELLPGRSPDRGGAAVLRGYIVDK